MVGRPGLFAFIILGFLQIGGQSEALFRVSFCAQLKIPRTTYQRELNEDRVRRIAAEFDERIANEPKVSCRDGRYYVFDGQHTIAARKLLNGGRDLPIRCKVFYGLTESDEALLFADK